MPAREDIGIIRSKRMAGKELVVLCVASSISEDCAPGEFVNIKIPSYGDDPFLRRPFSVAWTEPDEHIIEFLIRVCGRGTEALSALDEGARVSLLGPLGNRFPLETIAAHGAVDCIAGGVGSAPLLFLAQWVKRCAPRVDVRFFQGAQTRDALPEPERYAERISHIEFATDDGSYGFRGNVLELYQRHAQPDRIVCACGPTALLEKIRSE